MVEIPTTEKGIAQMGMVSIRVFNILKMNHLTFNNAFAMADDDLLKLKHFGPKSLAELRRAQMIDGQICYSNHNGQCHCTTLCPLVRSAWRLGIDKTNAYTQAASCSFYNPQTLGIEKS